MSADYDNASQNKIPNLVFCQSHVDSKAKDFLAELFPKLSKIGYNIITLETPAKGKSELDTQYLKTNLNNKEINLKGWLFIASEQLQMEEKITKQYKDKDPLSMILALTHILSKNGVEILRQYGVPIDSKEFKGKFTPLTNYAGTNFLKAVLQAHEKNGYKVIPLDEWFGLDYSEAIASYSQIASKREAHMANKLKEMDEKGNAMIAIVGSLHCDPLKKSVIEFAIGSQFRFINTVDVKFYEKLGSFLMPPESNYLFVKKYVEAKEPGAEDITVFCDLSDEPSYSWCKDWILNGSPLHQPTHVLALNTENNSEEL